MTREEIVKRLETNYGYSFTKDGEFGHEFDWLCELMEDVQKLVKESDSLPCVSDSFHCSTYDCGITRGRKCFKEKCEDWSGR